MRKHVSGLILLTLLVTACGATSQPSPTRNQALSSIFSWDSSVRAITLSDVNDTARFEEQLDRVVSLGFTAIRIPLDWAAFEPSRGKFAWRAMDLAIEATRVRGIAVMAAVANAPAWARDPRFAQMSSAPPKDPVDLETFVAAAAIRFKGAITAWEIFPGANVVGNFAPNVDAKRMCALIRSAYTAVKRVDTSSVVITGGTVQAPDTPRSVAPAKFIQQLYLCAKGSFDGIGMAPSTGTAVLTSTFGPGGVGAAVNAVHQISVLNGDMQRRIYFTGFGVPTGPAGVNDDTQAKSLVTGIHYLRSRDFAGTTVISEFQDVNSGTSRPEDNLGLTRSDGSAKPSLQAVASMRR